MKRVTFFLGISHFVVFNEFRINGFVKKLRAVFFYDSEEVADLCKWRPDRDGKRMARVRTKTHSESDIT